MPYSAKMMIDLERHPIHENGPARSALLDATRADLARDGCAVLKGFVRASAIKALVAEADGVSDKGHRSFNRTNPYFTKDNPALPKDDPRRQFFDRSNNFISADNFLPKGPLRTIHDFPAFDPFLTS